MSIPRYTAIVVLLAVSFASALAQAPSEVSFQGYMTDDVGNPLTGSYTTTFTLYRDGSNIWMESQSVQVNDGLFNVSLGSVTPLNTVRFDDPLELGIKVAKDLEMTPRVTLLSAAYARALPGLYTFYRDSGVSAGYSVIGGTEDNTVGSNPVAVTMFGGTEAYPNEVSGPVATVSGGYDNTAGEASVVGGGVSNSATNGSTVSGGSWNNASALGSTIGGGQNNAASGSPDFSTIGGGEWNAASGQAATVPGGSHNAATKGYTFAAGRRAKANHSGTFVWADSTSPSGLDFASTGTNQFLIRAGGGVGIGTNSPGSPLTVVGEVTTYNDNDTDAYVALFENPAIAATADGIAIKLDAAGSPPTGANFVGFFDGDDGLIGQIQGNGSGGVSYATTGADYAESLPLRDTDGSIESGDVVGIFEGRISRRTETAEQIFVVTDRPAVLGNMPPGKDESEGFAAVSFVGQVPVKVRGFVESGDFLIPSGLDDGVAVAVSPESIDSDQLGLVFATAWESSETTGVTRINAAIGVDQAAAAARVIQALRTRIEKQESQIESILARLAALEKGS